MNEQNMERPLATRPAAMLLKRISWGAVFAGLVVSLVTHLTLTLLGVGIGASTINFEQREPTAAMGIGALVWLVVTTIISLFLGGYVAARLAGVPRREDSVLHGIITWGAQTIVAFLLITSAVGGLMAGMAGMVGNVLSAAGRGVGRAATEAVGGARTTSERGAGQGIGGALAGLNWDAIKQDAQALLQQSSAQAPGEKMALDRALNQMFGQGQLSTNPADRQALIAEVAKVSGMSQEDAAQRVAQWEQTYQQAQQKFQQTRAEVEQKAREAGTVAAKGISRAALSTFLLLILGAIAAAAGASYGRPKVLVTEPVLPS